MLESTPDICGTRLTCLRILQTLRELHLELHEPWDDDHAGVNRRARAPIAQKKGAAWAAALRKHSNATCGHYYGHLAFAHMEELILEHGPFQHGNDEILEKGNLDMKRYRNMSYHGGDSSKEAQAAGVVQTRWRLLSEAANGVEAVYEPYDVKTTRVDASWVACFKMEAAADIVRGSRPHERSLTMALGKRKAAKAWHDSQRDKVKKESIAAAVRCVQIESLQ